MTTTEQAEPGPIVRQGYGDHRDKIRNPIKGHKPHWASVDCPSCGSAPCGPHPDVLVCECTDDYPCGEVRTFTAELDRLANEIWQEYGADNEVDADYVTGVDDAVRMMRARARQLRGESR